MKRIFIWTMMAAALLAGGLHAQSGYYDPEPNTSRENHPPDSGRPNDRWVLVTQGAADGRPVYLDTQTLQYRPAADPEYAWAWVNFTAQDGSYILVRYQIHRTNNHVRALAGLFYSAKGELTQSDYSPKEWQDTAPGSVGEEICKMVFSKTSNRKRRSDV